MEDKDRTQHEFVLRMGLLSGVVAVACASFFGVVALRHCETWHGAWELLTARSMLLSFLLIALVYVAAERWLNLDRIYRSRPYSYLLLLYVLENVLCVSALLLLFTLLGLPTYGRRIVVLFACFTTIGSFLLKVSFYGILRRYRKNGHNRRRLVVICDETAARLVAQINRHYEWGYQIVGLVVNDAMMHKVGHLYTCYPRASVDLEALLSEGVDECIYARASLGTNDLSLLLDICADYGVTFRLSSSFMNRVTGHSYVRYMDNTPLLTIDTTERELLPLAIKRALDIVASLGVIVVGAPFFLLVALAIKLDTPGPVFFRQERSGLRGKVFSLFKFRTMVANAEALRAELDDKNEMSGPVFKMANDPRITRVGRFLRKTGIDEFPQFLNVLVGQMSIVGPRPPLPAEVEQYERWQRRRLTMKPGITCIWQTSQNRNDISFDEWMRMDLDYIDNWKLSLDFVLVVKTIRTMLRADGK